MPSISLLLITVLPPKYIYISFCTCRFQQQAGAIGLELQGKVRITINVKDYTYTIKEVSDLPETMFINGSAYSSDWNWNDACQMIPVTQTPGMFWSMQYYNAGEEIKFSPVAGWTGDFGFSTDIARRR